MKTPKSILIIVGSAHSDSANQKLADYIVKNDEFEWIVFNALKTLPHFDPQLSLENTPQAIVHIRNIIAKADGVLICTPEYVFSIPSGLKNLIEWCVSTTVFSEKPLAIITASAEGTTAHEELQRIMKTLMASFTNDTTLLLQGIKGKLNAGGEITDEGTKLKIKNLINQFSLLINSAGE